jgi:AraC family transcriptional regulator, arabinose operon regulatory protein
VSFATSSESRLDITSGWPLPANGVRILVPHALTKLLSEHPLSRDLYPIAAGYYPHASGHSMHRLKHADNLLAYCIEGGGKLYMESGSWSVAAGDLMLVPIGTAHTYAADSQKPWSLYWVHYAGELATGYTEFLGIDEPVAPIGVHPRLLADFEALFALRNAGGNERAFIHAASVLKAMLTDIAVLTVAYGNSRGTRIDLDLIQQMMHRQLDRDLSLEDLAQVANLSKFHFIRKFKQLTGHAPIQHFIHLKMQHACQLLDTTQEPIKRIANRVGYNDPHYFSRLFKRVIGVSPQQYRQHRLA